MARNPIKDHVAIVGVGSTGFKRLAGRSSASLAAEASIKAIRDANLEAKDIDGISGSAEPGSPSARQMATILGLEDVTHFTTSIPVTGFAIIDAMTAIFSGMADTVLVYYPVLRLPGNSRAAGSDPFRRDLVRGVPEIPESITYAPAYAAWASRYIHEFGTKRESFGRIAINSRTNGANNPLAVFREPITMDDYLSARMIREPLCMLNMDIPVDGADAFILTTAERARDLTTTPVLIHAAAAGVVGNGEESQLPGLSHHGQHVVIKNLRERSDLWLDDVDVYYPYDGFTIITMSWFENAGWCGPGEGAAFIEANWDATANRIVINGRTPVNTHGGALSEGATRGSGYFREVVHQLRGQAGERQVKDAKVALATLGGFFLNSQGFVFRTE